MREIVLDTETTGFKPEEGHRLVEIGCLELMNHIPTGKVFHRYVNPERDVPLEAEAVHGLSTSRLMGEPLFAAIAGPFLEFIGDAPLVIHNARFDMAFLNAELARINLPSLPDGRAIDTLEIARNQFPRQQNSLDALCRRFNVDNSGRIKHGALLDAELLAEVYLELMGGRQAGLSFGSESDERAGTHRVRAANPRPAPLPSHVSEEEKAAHAAFIASFKTEALWIKLGNGENQEH